MPLSLRDVKLQKSDTVWSDVGGTYIPYISYFTALLEFRRLIHSVRSVGLRETKKVLRETLEWPTKYGPIFAQSPLRLRSGYVV